MRQHSPSEMFALWHTSKTVQLQYHKPLCVYIYLQLLLLVLVLLLM